MIIEAKVIADSLNNIGDRITTMVVTFPRIILAEFNTHRAFSRNSASSRAIPFEKMLKAVESNPFVPIAFQKDHKGMQGIEYLQGDDDIKARTKWLEAKWVAFSKAKELAQLIVTKQLCNRLLEPFMWQTVIVTATEWENFFALRCPSYVLGTERYRSKKDWLHIHTEEEIPLDVPQNTVEWLEINEGQAEIHIMALAEAMWDAYNESTPNQLKDGEWHIPYNKEIVDLMKADGNYNNDLYEEEIEGTDNHTWSTSYKLKASSMIAARTSYTIVGEDQKPWTFNKYVEKAEELQKAVPVHASPFEHCALADSMSKSSRNFTNGWIQYREYLGL